MDDSPITSGARTSVEFYLPATFQFRNEPSRVERFLGRLFGRRDEEGRPGVETGGREFYLPGTPDVMPVQSR